MSNRSRVPIVAILAASYAVLAAAAEKAAPEPRIACARTAFVWSGKEMLLWTGAQYALAFDPDKNTWRAVKTDAYPGRNLQREFVRLSDGAIFAAYWVIGEETRLCFDRYSPDTGQWRRTAFVNREDFENEKGQPSDVHYYTLGGKEYAQFPLRISGIAALDDGAVVFVAGTRGDPAIRGLRVEADGTKKFVAHKDACPESYRPTDTAVCALGGRVLYFGYARVDANLWGVWDAKADTWTKPEEEDRRYSFNHCQVGDDVYVFGGAESSAFGWAKRDGRVYSFKDNRWRPMPVDGGPPARRDFAMCWTGKAILVWGGYTLGALREDTDKGAAKVPLNAVMAYDPKTQRWQALPGKDAPPARANCATVWTGREMIVWGGGTEKAGFSDGYAYNPDLGRWRKLPEVPKELPKP